MEARPLHAAVMAASLSSLGAQFRTPNFVVEAPTPEIARQVGQAAEKYRHDLAIHWLGEPLPKNWSRPCPVDVKVGNSLGAGGATSFLFDRGEVYGWQMNIQGSLERVLDSVLPHEVTHTIFASYFRRPLPRWADEGACTTVEHDSERAKQQQMLIHFLRNGRGISFSSMFMMKEYPRDILPLYSQGYSLTSFLIQRGGRRKLLDFLADGTDGDRWVEALRTHYQFPSLAAVQDDWLDWVRRGSPPSSDAQPPTDGALADADRPPRPQPNLIYRGQSEDAALGTGDLVPVRPAGSRARTPQAVLAQSNAGPSGPAAGGGSDPRPQQPRTPTGRPRQVLLEWSRDAAPTRRTVADPVRDASAPRPCIR